MPPCSGQSRPSPAGGREDAASLDRPCARRLRELAVGMEEYSRRGSNQRMRPKRARKPTISNRWFSGNFRLALTTHNTAASDLWNDIRIGNVAETIRVIGLGDVAIVLDPTCGVPCKHPVQLGNKQGALVLS